MLSKGLSYLNTVGQSIDKSARRTLLVEFGLPAFPKSGPDLLIRKSIVQVVSVSHCLSCSRLLYNIILLRNAMLARYVLWPQVCLCLSQVGVPADEKSSLKEAWSGSRDPF